MSTPATRVPALAAAAFAAVATVASARTVAPPPTPPTPPSFLLLEPVAGEADRDAVLPLFRPIADATRLAQIRPWTEGEAARLAAEVVRLALAAAGPEVAATQLGSLPIVLLPDGAGARVGLRIADGTGTRVYPRAAYVELAAEEWRFTAPLLHEAGHVALAILAGGQELPRRELSAVPHTLPVLSDRATAFDEGFAIHLEALLAHIGTSPAVRRMYWRDQLSFGPAAGMRSEYFRVPADLFTYGQGLARYQAVRDNHFAFQSAFKGPDYLRVQLDAARDFAALRNPNQLLQAEGFVASVFFSIVARGGTPSAETTRARLAVVMGALRSVLAAPVASPDAPLLLNTVLALVRQRPNEAADVIDVVNDLSHGAFVDRRAGTVWRELYRAALRLDLEAPAIEAARAARDRCRSAALADPSVILALLGPQLSCRVPGRIVRLAGFRVDGVLCLDVNTAEEGTLRLVPGISDQEVDSWLAAREARPFASSEDFRARAGLRPATVTQLAFPQSSSGQN